MSSNKKRDAKKSAVERYRDLDTKSSNEDWNDDFGIVIIDVFESAINNGELNKTVEELVYEIERRLKGV